MNLSSNSITVNAPVEEVFAFYTDLRNVVRMALPELHLRVLKAEQPLRLGSRTLFMMRPSMVPYDIKWSTRIVEFEPPHKFVDEQIKGPFEHWAHTHELEDLGDGMTRITDTIDYGAPMGFLGRLAEQFLISHKLDKAFEHRERVIREALERSTAQR